MYLNILIPTDGSEVAAKAVEAGTAYAQEAGASVVFFTAVPEYPVPSEADILAHKRIKSIGEHEADAAATAREILERVAAKAKEANITFQTDYVLCDRPSEAIIEAAKRHGCDAIFMASHARTGLKALWYGSQTRDVLTQSDIPTLVYR